MLCILPTTKARSLYHNISKDLMENNCKPRILYLLFEGQRDILRLKPTYRRVYQLHTIPERAIKGYTSTRRKMHSEGRQ